jgi:hypothetical protein
MITNVRVFAPPIAACGGGGNPWKSAAELVFERLRRRFPTLRFEFFEYFSQEFFQFPDMLAGLQTGTLETPVIMAGDEIIPSGGKISERNIREFLETRMAVYSSVREKAEGK